MGDKKFDAESLAAKYICHRSTGPSSSFIYEYARKKKANCRTKCDGAGELVQYETIAMPDPRLMMKNNSGIVDAIFLSYVFTFDKALKLIM